MTIYATAGYSWNNYVLEKGLVKHSVYKRLIQPGLTVGFAGAQDEGKSLCAVALVVQACATKTFKPEDVTSNVAIPLLGIRKRSDEQCLDWIETMVSKKRKHQILFFDEADDSLTHFNSVDRDESTSLLPIQRVVKNGNLVVYTQHFGRGVNLVLRSGTLVVIVPHRLFEITPDGRLIGQDAIRMDIADGRFCRMYTRYLEPATPVMNLYNRWD